MPPQEKNIKGFSILELLVVLALVAIISGAAYPNFSEWNKERVVRSDVDKIAALIKNTYTQTERGALAYVQIYFNQTSDGLFVEGRGLTMSTLATKINDGSDDWNDTDKIGERCDPGVGVTATSENANWDTHKADAPAEISNLVYDITVTDVKNGTAQSREDKEFSPRAGIIYKPKENVSWYYSYSESFLPRSGEQFKSLSASSAALDPDVYESTEVGVKVALNDGLSLTAAYFDSEQTVATRDSVTGETNEIVGLQVDGLELEVKGKVTDKMSVVFGYTSMDGKTSSGGEPREIPDTMLSLFATYEVSDKFGWALGMTKQGESNISNNKPGLVLPEYTRVDLGAYYQIADDLSVQMNIENLTDELYFPHSHSTHQASVGEPFNMRISIRKTF